MSGYRFCRSDDIALLVDALNRCWLPHFDGAPAVTPASFKRSIRDLQVWCSSCMVAFSGADPIGVLIGAKRPSGTLVYRIAVHPDHLRQGHGRHLLASLSAKLSILGPPRMMAEVPAGLTAARALFRASGYVEEGVLTDYVWEARADGEEPEAFPSPLLIPLTVDDLAANDLLQQASAPWERSVATLMARKEEIEGLAVASDERLEACVLYINEEIVLLRSLGDDGGRGLAHLFSRLRAQGKTRLWISKVHPEELSPISLDRLGFRPAGAHVLYTATAGS